MALLVKPQKSTLAQKKRKSVCRRAGLQGLNRLQKTFIVLSFFVFALLLQQY
jgi:hypothetical protein